MNKNKFYKRLRVLKQLKNIISQYFVNDSGYYKKTIEILSSETSVIPDVWDGVWWPL